MFWKAWKKMNARRLSIRLRAGWVVIALAAGWPGFAAAKPNLYEVTASSYLGASGGGDCVHGCAVQSDGTVVIAANIGDARPGGLTPALVNGATHQSWAAILRLSADGRSVLSVTRVAERLLDLAIDERDNIYVAMWSAGAAKLDPRAGSVIWSRSDASCQRIDAGAGGYCAALGGGSDPDDKAYDINVYDPNGTEVGSFRSSKWKYDVCIDEASQTVIYIGFRNAHTSGNPVQICYIRGSSYTGRTKYTCYDWSADSSSPDWINRPENNMADTRGYRCSIGRDGRLYCAFECAGGNHIFRYDPLDIMTSVSIVGGDQWHEFHNTRSEHKTFFGRYEAATGRYILGQQLCCRLSNGRGNTIRVERGQICADELGRVCVGGTSAWGLPLPPHPKYSVKPGETAFNPMPEGYLGGAWLLVISEDFKSRLYCTRLTQQRTCAIDVRVLHGTMPRLVWGGYCSSQLYTNHAIQGAAAGDQDGWFAVISTPGGDLEVKR